MKWVLRVLGAIAGLLVLAFLGLLIAGHRPDAGKLESSVEIARPPAEVWPWVTEGDKQKQWISWLVETRQLTASSTEPGSRVEWVMVDPNNNNQRMSMESELVLAKPPNQFSVKITSAMFSGQDTYTLTALPGGATRVTTSGSFTYTNWFARFMEPLITPSARKKMTADFAQLKKLVEQGPKTP